MTVNTEVVIALSTAVTAWGVYVTFALRRLVWMHEHADQTKFGTVGLKSVIDGNSRAIKANTRTSKELIHYVRWAYTQRNGGEGPPPFVSDPDDE